MNDQASVEAAHLRVAELVQGLHNRPDTDSDTVVAELAEHAAAERAVHRRKAERRARRHAIEEATDDVLGRARATAPFVSILALGPVVVQPRRVHAENVVLHSIKL